MISKRGLRAAHSVPMDSYRPLAKMIRLWEYVTALVSDVQKDHESKDSGNYHSVAPLLRGGYFVRVGERCARPSNQRAVIY